MENIRNDRHPLQYITEIVQRGRIKPAKFKHFLKMPMDIYIDLRDNNVIQPENYFIEESCFFEDKGDYMYMNFVTQCMIDDLHLRIMDYLLKKIAYNPIERGGIMF